MSEETKTRRSSEETGRFAINLSDPKYAKALAALKAVAKDHEHSLPVEARRILVPVLEASEYAADEEN